MARRCKQCRSVELLPAAKCADIVEKKGFCSVECLVLTQRKKVEAAKLKERKRQHRADKERIKSLATICSDAQSDVNAMIRAADAAKGFRCIASGHAIADCGHFYHAGSKYRTSWLRFHHANLHGQGAHSNRYSGGGDALNYLNGLRERYGQQYIDELEDFKRVQDQGGWPKPTREEVKALAKWCRAMEKIYRGMI